MTHQASHALRLPYHYFNVTKQKHNSDRLKAVLPLWFLLLFLPRYRKFGGFSYWQLRVWFCHQKRTAATVRSRDLTATHSSKQHSEGFHNTESSMLESPYPGLMPWSSSTPTQAVHGVFVNCLYLFNYLCGEQRRERTWVLLFPVLFCMPCTTYTQRQ